MRAGWWVAGLGGIILFLVALALNETEVRQNGPLIVFPQVPRTVALDQTLDCRLAFEGVRDNGTSPQQLQNLRLRFARNFEKQWQIVEIVPTPDQDTRTAGGRLLKYELWPIESAWRVQLRPRNVGRQRFVIAIDAKDFLVLPYSATINVTRKPIVSAKNSPASIRTIELE